MDFSKLTAYLDTLGEVGVPGCDLAVYRDHAPLYRHTSGFRDAALTQPVREDDTYCLYSCTKVFTTCAVMQLVEQGRLNLDDPVGDYLPAYGRMMVRDGDAVRPARRTLTIRHLMSMQSGMNYDLESQPILETLRATGGQATTRQLVDAMARVPLDFEPGTDFFYSLGHDVLAVVIEVVSGERFSDYLRRHIFEPLKLKTIGFEVRDPARQCAQYLFDEETGTKAQVADDANVYRLSPNYESGGAGLVSDVLDYITFADALACGGSGLLSPEMIQLWSANQLGPRSRKSFDELQRLGYSYALGVRTRVDMSKGGRGQIGEFGWDGACGAWVLIDPINHLSAFFAMHVRHFEYSYDVIHPRIRNLIYEGLGEPDRA